MYNSTSIVRKILLAIAVLTLVGTVAMWARSYWVWDSIIWTSDYEEIELFVESGSMQFLAVDNSDEWDPDDAPLVFEYVRGPADSADRLQDAARMAMLWEYQWDDSLVEVQCPMWCLVLTVGIMTCIMGKPIMRVRYRRRHNLCLNCGYDLTGKTSGTCSECGSTVDREQRKTERT